MTCEVKREEKEQISETESGIGKGRKSVEPLAKLEVIGMYGVFNFVYFPN